MSEAPARVRVRHIGKHDVRKDTMTGTGTVWNGYGDVKEVSAKDWAILQRYPDLWVLDTPDAPKEPPPDRVVVDVPQPKTLEQMDRQELVSLANDLGLRADGRAGRDVLIKAITKAQAA